MLTEENDVEMHALHARGWNLSAISRHTGRDRKTIRRYLAGEGPGQIREAAPSCLEPFRGYIAARFVDDPHLPAVTLFDELTAARFERSYPTLVRELRGQQRPRWAASTSAEAGRSAVARLRIQPTTRESRSRRSRFRVRMP
jgi:transposase